jgi:glyoxylase-like metal-dependent hydrolase (beta-lactamase superfamily II)
MADGGELYRWRIGDVPVVRIPDHEVALNGEWLVTEFTPGNIRREREWLYSSSSTDDGRIRMSFHSMLVESEGLRIVIDTCLGNNKPRPAPAWDPALEWHMRKGPYLDHLARAGFTRESIDLVVLTHLHGDHLGWNTMLEGGRWVPTFPNARYLIVREEWDYWSQVDQMHFRVPLNDSLLPVIEAGLVDWVKPTHRINDEIFYEPTPGHTPGHVAVVVASRGESAVTTGDLIHHPVQCAYPEWICTFDLDSALAAKTRRNFLSRCADDRSLVFGTHFAAPSAGRVVRHETAFRYVV